jgi:hypothetical protein
MELTLELWRPTLGPLSSPWDRCGSRSLPAGPPESHGAHLGAVEAHPRTIEAHHGAVEARPGAL